MRDTHDAVEESEHTKGLASPSRHPLRGTAVSRPGRGTSTDELAANEPQRRPFGMSRSRIARPQRFLVIRPLAGLSGAQESGPRSLTTLTECLTAQQKVPHKRPIARQRLLTSC